ncbi:hypothetical protein ACROYT_G029795 [Oculina patagonica]
MAKESSAVKSISLSLTSQYAPSWKTWEGIRELVQNWHDGVFSSLEKLQGGSKVDFLCCKENDLLLYRAVIKAENRVSFERNTKEKNNFDGLTNQTQKRDHQTFDGSPQDGHRLELGRIVYSPAKEKLTLINRDTELMRKVLLLGFSKKASSKEVIGQFGEGLKVGALALVREGRVVSMETSKDRWRFGLSHDEAFDEEVLTVFVDDRWKENDDDDDDDDVANLGQTDTRVSVFPLYHKDWEMYLRRFLFLCPPSDYVKSQVGTLLLGERYKGQLFVKGVWVSDLSKDGLASGVDFVYLKIDRDRRAVVHLSDVDHQISSMWVHAIEQRPDLIPHYYRLLEENCTSDVRHANFYISDKSALLKLVAQHFFTVHGSMTYPIPNCISAEKLSKIKQEIDQKLVLCNQSLIDVLYRSGLVDPLDTILSRATTKQSVTVPFADLTRGEINILQHVEKLVQLCYPEFSMVSMDISESAGQVVLRKEFGHYEIPRALLSGKADHCCEQKNSTKCFCREAFIVSMILNLQSEQLVQVGTSSLGGHSDSIVKLVASLSMQVCRMNQPFCKDLHGELQSSYMLLNPSVLKQREEMLQREKDLLSEKLLEKDRSHAQELLKLQSKISSLEKDLGSQEVKIVNIEQEVSAAWKKRFESEMANLSSTITDLKRDKIFHQERLAAVVEDHKNKQKAHSRQVGLLNDRSEILRKRLAGKFEKLTQIVLASKEREDSAENSVADVLKSATKEIEEMWFRKDNCIICTIEKPNCVVIPCRHQITCYQCTSFLVKCSYCRGPIKDMIVTYGL